MTLDVRDFEICRNCGHIALVGEKPRHVAVMAIECRCDGWIPIDLDDFGARTSWREFQLSRVERREVQCPHCGSAVKLTSTGRCIGHTRPRRDDEKRRKARVPCEGSRCVITGGRP